MADGEINRNGATIRIDDNGGVQVEPAAGEGVEFTGPDTGGDATRDSVNTGGSTDVLDTPLFAQSGLGRWGMVLQGLDKSTGESNKANIEWLSIDDELIAAITAHDLDQHFSLYTRQDPYDGSRSGLKKRLDVHADGEYVDAIWNFLREYRVKVNRYWEVTQRGNSRRFRADPSDNQLKVELLPDPADSATSIEFADSDGDGQYALQNRSNRLEVVDRVNNKVLIEFSTGRFQIKSDYTARIDGRLIYSNPYSNADSSDLFDQELAVDTNRGGTGNTAILWNDNGTVHYFDSDGTV